MLRCHKPSQSTGESSVGDKSGEINTPAKREPGPSRQGLSIRNERLPDDLQNDQPEEDHEDPSSISGTSSAADPLSTPDPSAVQNTSSTPGPPSVPATDPYHREITHDTNIHLGLLVDGKSKGDFIELWSSVKVCWGVQHSKFLLMHCSFTPSLTRKN